MADWVRSPTTPSEHPNPQNLGLADWPLSGNRYGRFGHNPEIESFKFTAAKQPLKFRGGGQEPAGATECTGLFAGSPDCWHGHLLNSGRRLHLVPAERYEEWVQAIRPDPFEDQ